jgi:hypothetical protein
MLLQLCGAIFSALPHDAPRPATLKWEYCMKGALAQDADASSQEDAFPQVFHPQQASAAPFDTIFPKG